MENDAKDFLSRKNAYSEMRSFHQTLRHEIHFALVPRTFESGLEQRAPLDEVGNLLTEKGFLRDQGLNQLGTIRKFCKIINEPLHFQYKKLAIEDFCSQSKFRSSSQIGQLILELPYWPVIPLDNGVHAVCFTDYTQSGSSYELTIRDSASPSSSARDPNKTPFTIEYPSNTNSRLCDANTKHKQCLYFTIL